MFRIVTFNANGVRSALTKGFFNWFQAQNADVLCIQELKAQEKDIPAEVAGLPGYQAFFHCAEGRYVEAIFGDLSVISCYFPSGSSSEERQEAKFRFLASFLKHMDELRTSGRRVILCGDVNIAHKEIDLKNWKGNVKNSGFLPEERQWLTDLFVKHGWRDVFRLVDARPEQYTWWSQRGQARAKNVGWRIDYHLATENVAAAARAASIYPDEKFSDHAPLTIDYDFSLED